MGDPEPMRAWHDMAMTTPTTVNKRPSRRGRSGSGKHAKPGGAARPAPESGAPAAGGGGPGGSAPGRRRRRRGPVKEATPSAAKVLAEARPPTLDQAAEVPMTPAEVARMKATLRFLREHRETLKLKVNAAEDLLLNGRREPTHRGLCQHLLSKLDRARVLSASERLPPAQATELLGGIVRFAPEIPYVVRFLQCVKASEDRTQTAAALTQALEQLDFKEASAAQMRDILLLIVEVFPPAELPVFAFSLLNREAFRSAFDRSSEGWPESLSALLLPLRAFHRALLAERGQRQKRQGRDRERLSLAEVKEGARLLLGASPASLLELGEGVRRRLFDVGCEALSDATSNGAPDSLMALFRGLGFRDPDARSSAALRLAGSLLRAHREKLARQVLRAEVEAGGEAREARQWLEALDGARIGNVAFERRRRGQGQGPGAEPALPADRWQRGWHVPTQQDVLVRLGPAEPAEARVAGLEALRSHAELRRRALFPSITPLVEAALEPQGNHPQGNHPQGNHPQRSDPPYIALGWRGPPLSSRVERGAGSAEQIVSWCTEACLLLGALAAAGLELPDAALHRFSVSELSGDRGGGLSTRLWLSDLWGARELTPSAAQASHLVLARQFCTHLLGGLDLDVLSAESGVALQSSSSIGELIEILRRL
jgi:hypothetical protein